MDDWLINGIAGNQVSVTDRGLAYGDGLFETIAWRDGRPRFLERHMERLRHGCRRLAIPEPDAGLIAGEIDRLGASVPDGVIKILITRGKGPRGYATPPRVEPTRIVGLTGAGPASPLGTTNAARVVVCRTPASVNPFLAGLKTLNRLDNVLASREWLNADCDEGLMLDPDGRVIGGTMSNVFLIRGRQLFTPSLKRCGIRGVMRAVVLVAARDAGVEVEETDLRLDDVERADELFLTNALWGIRPVHECAGRSYNTGPLTREIGAMLRNLGVDECPC